MNPDKTAIEKLWEKHSQEIDVARFGDPALTIAKYLMDKDDFLAALSEAEGERWISVKERFPANGEVVLVWFEDEPFPYMDVWKYDGTNRYFRPDSGKNDTSPHQRVTHWQPLPAPPKEKP